MVYVLCRLDHENRKTLRLLADSSRQPFVETVSLIYFLLSNVVVCEHGKVMENYELAL